MPEPRMPEQRPPGKPPGAETSFWGQPTVEPTERWIRVRRGGELLADSRRALLLRRYQGGGLLPTYFLPLGDVRPDAPYQPPPADRPELTGHVTFGWEDVEWFEEDEQVFVHARDPNKRVDVLASSRRVQVLIEGVLLADSTRPRLLFETGLPTRYYLPAEDVQTELLEPTQTATRCPYKGIARYWSARVGERTVQDVVWSYPDPVPQQPALRDLLCFFNEKVDLVVDGVEVSRPQTPWS